MIIRPLLITAVSALLCLSFPARAEDNLVCHRFFDGVRTRAVAILRDPAQQFTEKKTALSRLFDESVDGAWIARFVAGAQWRTAREDERRSFIAAYRAYLPRNYIGGLNEEDINEMQDIKLVSFTPVDLQSYHVHTQVVQKSDEPIAIDFTLEEDPPGVCHIRDFVIEGISLLASQREQIQSIAASGGLTAATERLQTVVLTKSN